MPSYELRYHAHILKLRADNPYEVAEMFMKRFLRLSSPSSKEDEAETKHGYPNLESDIGPFPDEMDSFAATDEYYAPPKQPLDLNNWIKDNPDLEAVMPRYWTATDPVEAFACFHDSGIPSAVENLMLKFNVNKHHHICDLGCGKGHLVWSLHKRGFEKLSAMDPAVDYTGYVKSTAPDIELIKSIDEWKKIAGRFDAIVSNGVIHHWHHIPLVARDARQTLKPGGFWFAIQEAYANTPRDLVQQMRNHPTALRFGHYEWFYPASAYVDLVQSVGFSLMAVIPYGYRNNQFLYPNVAESEDEFSAAIDRDMGATVEKFWFEVDQLRRDRHSPQVFTIPQVLVFRRVAI